MPETFIPDEIYIFANVFRTYDIKTIYKEITQDSTVELTIPLVVQLMLNMNYEEKHINAIKDETRTNIGIDELKEILDFNNYHELLISKPLGKIVRTNSTIIGESLLFPSHPGLLIYTTDNDKKLTFQFFAEPLDENENAIFLNNKFVYDNQILVYTADHLIKWFNLHGKTKATNEANLFQYYFPALFQNYGITTVAEYYNYRSLSAPALIDPNTIKSWQTIEAFYEHYGTINSAEDYPNCFPSGAAATPPAKGCFASDNFKTNIMDFSVTLKSIYKITIPLDILFKKIHVSHEIPMIKFNPGLRQKNILRFYFEQITHNGMQIPFIDKAEINNIK